MNLFNRLPGFTRSPPGLERSIFKELPRALAAGTLIPLLCYLIAWYHPAPAVGETTEKYLADVGIVAISVVVTVWTAVFTLAIGCFIVMVMKGPAYVADRYHMHDAEAPDDPIRSSDAHHRHRDP